MKWLKSSWKIGHVGGVEIRLHFSLLFSIVITYFIFRPTDIHIALLAFSLLTGFIFSIFLHELAHALAAKLVRTQAKSIVIWLLGGLTNLSREPENPFHRLLIYFAGPFTTILLGLSFYAIYYFMPYAPPSSSIYGYSIVLSALATINVILFVFNILPIYPLDGGNMLHALAEIFFGKPRANLITMVISIPVLIGLILFGIYSHDYILLIFCVFIALAIGTLNRHTLRWMNLGINYLLRRGGYYFLQGDYDRAVQYYTRALEHEPRNVNHLIGRSVCYLWMLQKDKALVDIERALEIAPDNAVVLMMRGDLYALDKNYDLALDLFARAQQLNQKWAAPYIDRATVLMDTGQLEPALEEFNKAAPLASQIPLFYVERSIASCKLGNLDAAHRDQDSALQLSEKEALTRAEFNIDVYAGNLDWAEDYYARALSKLPRSWYAYQGRADAYRVNGKHDQAIADYTRALQINPREPRLYLGRGKSYLVIGNLECAVADFQQVFVVTDKGYLRGQAEDWLKSLKQEVHI